MSRALLLLGLTSRREALLREGDAGRCADGGGLLMSPSRIRIASCPLLLPLFTGESGRGAVPLVAPVLVVDVSEEGMAEGMLERTAEGMPDLTLGLGLEPTDLLLSFFTSDLSIYSIRVIVIFIIQLVQYSYST